MAGSPEVAVAMIRLCGIVVMAAAAVMGLYRLAAALEAFAPRAVPPEDDPMDVEIPHDLLAFATSLKDEWAAEDTVKVIRERYADLRDWNRVRSAMGIGSLPENT